MCNCSYAAYEYKQSECNCNKSHVTVKYLKITQSTNIISRPACTIAVMSSMKYERLPCSATSNDRKAGSLIGTRHSQLLAEMVGQLGGLLKFYIVKHSMKLRRLLFSHSCKFKFCRTSQFGGTDDTVSVAQTI